MRRPLAGIRLGPRVTGWWAAVLGMLALASAGTARQAVSVAPPGRAALIEHLERFIVDEMQSKGLPAMSVALVDDLEMVWAKGFGMADPDAKVPATADTVYRVGSVSKLFTDIGVMQLVERGQLDLDAPVARYLPSFRPDNPSGRPITLRQLMSHRSGLVREPPVGSYFDEAGPSLEETVASLNDRPLIYAPETRAKYSNAGIAVVGYVLERLQGQPFARHLREAVLDPLGMTHSSFEPSPRILAGLARSWMWTYDGRIFPAPRFELGMAPAGSMYSTVTDLARFMGALFRRGVGLDGHRILEPDTLEEMYTPQFSEPGTRTGFGLGFAVSELAGRRLVRHGGAIYGFATELAFLPDERVGVVAVTTMDSANTVVRRVAIQALESLLAVRDGHPPPNVVRSDPVDAGRARRLAGRYADADEIVELVERAGRLWMLRGTSKVELKAQQETLIVDDRHAYGVTVRELSGAIAVDGRTFRRVEARRPEEVPPRWTGLIGEYGWDFNTLYILERGGRLSALIEWFELDALDEISDDVYAFPRAGLYEGERLVFRRDARGVATEVEVAGVVFPRRPIGTDEGDTFRITPLQPVEALRAAARAAVPPAETGRFREPDLVEIASLDPTIELDVRYATTDNFMGAVFYAEPRAFLQRPAAEALVRVHRALAARGLGLLIHDAYRPWYVTKMFFDATPEAQKIFVADPVDGSRHNRGCAVDLTLFDRVTGRPVRTTGGYDEFSTRSYPDYPGGTSLQRWYRDALREAMESEGFSVYEYEWWHFDFRDWRSYPILNEPFEALDR